LASISNGGTAVNAGWAVDLAKGNRIDVGGGKVWGVELFVALAVSDNDGWINRFSYSVFTVGVVGDGGWL
jgi:hypothetical protein